MQEVNIVRHKKAPAALTLLASMLWSLSASVADDTTIWVGPKWKFGGTTYVEWRFQNKLTSSGDQLPEEGWEQRYDTRLGCLLRVDDVSETGDVRFTLTFDRVAVSTENPSGTTHFDSDVNRRDDRSPLGLIVHDMLGTPMSLEVKNCGRDIRVSGTEAIRKSIEDSNPDKKAYGSVRSFLDAEMMRFLWEWFFALYPCGEVNEGTTWTRQVTSIRKLHTIECEIDEIETSDGATVVRVVYSATGRVLPEFDAEVTPDGAQHKYGVSREAGSAVIDANRGQIVGVTGTIEVDHRTITPNPSGGMPSRQLTAKTGKSTITVLSEVERKAQKAKRKDSKQS